jgi:glycosyltransferase involved in cell wall biosynthesis
MLDLPQFHVRIVGESKLNPQAAQELSRTVALTGPVPRHEIARQYDWADVFVLPTLSEGSAAVCYEALASGLPVITTPHSGSVVRDGTDGFIVPIRNAERLAECLELLASNRDRLAEMSSQALDRSQGFTITGYARRLIPALTEQR